MSDEHEIEAGMAAAEGDRERAIAQIVGTLQGDGADECRDCGDVIPAARRVALPSAERCVRCQTQFEQRGGGHA